MTLQKDPEQNETKYLRRYAQLNGKRVLEVGCGEGRLTWRYAKDAASVQGIDLDREGLRVATIERPSDLAKRVGFSESDATHLPFPKQAFDIAVLSWSF